jgi:uncharacterized membrane protein YfcA
MTAMGIDPNTAIRTAFGTGLLTVIPTALSGALSHHRSGSVLWKPAITLGIIGGVGAFAGALIAARLPAEYLTVMFGAVVIVLACKMIFGSTKPAETRKAPLFGRLLWLGIPVGILAGVIGVGGGGIMTPIMVTYLGFRIHEAVGTSTAAMMCTAVGGALSYLVSGWGLPGLPAFSTGYLNWLQFAALAASGAPMARVGAYVAHKLPARKVEIIFAGLQVYIGLKLIGVFSWVWVHI